jgi:hypothetical protein
MSKFPVFAFVFIFSILILHPVQGQEEINCSDNLQTAQEQFEMGQVEEVPQLLIGCLQSGFTPQERIRAYKLLINAYIFDDNIVEAENYVLEFMRRYPEYKPDNTDAFEFINLFEQFDNNPRASIGLYAGTGFSNVRISEPFGVHDYSLDDESESSLGNYRSGTPGFQAGVLYNHNLTEKFELSAEPGIYQQSFIHELEPFDFTKVAYTEKQFGLSLPLSLLYWIETDRKFNPYFRTGASVSWLLRSRSITERNYTNTGQVSLEDIIGPEVETTDSRSRMNFHAFLGGGVRYQIPQAFFFLDIRYHIGLNKMVNNDNRSATLNDNPWLFYYQEDNYYMDAFTISVGYAKTLYRPKRK